MVASLLTLALCSLTGVAAAPAVVPDLSAWAPADRALGFVAADAGEGAEGRRALLLRYADGRVARAEVGPDALVTLPAGGPPEAARLAAWSLRLVRPLMPSIGLWLARSVRDDEDGLALARRLRALTEPDAPRDAFPDLWLARKKAAAPPPDDPLYPAQWFFSDLGMPEAWALTRGSPDVTVVVIDDGCQLDHPDLRANMDSGTDVVSGDADPSYVPRAATNYHGTACAGLVAARTGNATGVAGACPECRLRCVRLLGSGASAVPLSADVDAFQFALAVDADIVSNSWGYVDAIPVPRGLANAINQVADHGRGGLGALVFFAAGNDDRRIGDDELVAVRGVIGVGAVNHWGDTTSYTNYGNSVDLVAPTGSVTTDITGSDGDSASDYSIRFGGTSSACPIAAGVAGLLLTVAPDRTAAELTQLLLDTTRRAPYAEPDENGHDDYYGRGILDPVKALRELVPEAPDAGPAPDAGGAGAGGDEPEGCGCAQGAGAWLAALPLLARRRRASRPARASTAARAS